MLRDSSLAGERGGWDGGGVLQGAVLFPLAPRTVRNSSSAPPGISPPGCLPSSCLSRIPPAAGLPSLSVCCSGSQWRCPAAGLRLTVSSPPPAGWPGPAPSVSELERRRLEEALEAAQGEARGAQLREEQLQAQCERLQEELKQLQETRAQVRDAGAAGTGLGPGSDASPAPWRSGGCRKQRLAVKTSPLGAAGPGDGRGGASRPDEAGVRPLHLLP